jgi:hypothetical protein
VRVLLMPFSKDVTHNPTMEVGFIFKAPILISKLQDLNFASAMRSIWAEVSMSSAVHLSAPVRRV